jgi:hypothetical protein
MSSVAQIWMVSFRGELDDAASAALGQIGLDSAGRHIGPGRPDLNHVQVAAGTESDALAIVMDTVKEYGHFSDWQVTALD